MVKTKDVVVKPPRWSTAGALSTSSTLLNVALTGEPDAGIPVGSYVLVVGDSGSGKTYLNMTWFAEACANPAFNGHDLIYDPSENGMLMDVKRLFGEKAAKRIRAPAKTKKGKPLPSRTIEDFYFNVDDANERGKPFIYVEDSMDGLSSEAEEKFFDKAKKDYRKGRAIDGSYGDGKAKKNSVGLRRIVQKIEKTRSILVIVCQSKDVLNKVGFGETKTRSGGRSLKFYAHAELWTSVLGAIKKKVRGKNRRVGDQILVKIKKNRFTGKQVPVKLRLLDGYGIDDVGSCVDYLVEERWWKKRTGGVIDAGKIGQHKRDALIREIETSTKGLSRMKLAVKRCWQAIEAECAPQRKPRYA